MSDSECAYEAETLLGLTYLAKYSCPPATVKFLPRLGRWALHLESLDPESAAVGMLRVLCQAYQYEPTYDLSDPGRYAFPGITLRYTCTSGERHSLWAPAGCALILGGPHISYVDPALVRLLDHAIYRRDLPPSLADDDHHD